MNFCEIKPSSQAGVRNYKEYPAGGRKRERFIEDASRIYSRRLFYYVRNIIRSNEDAEDLVQETFFRLCRVQDLTKVRNVEAFLFTTAYRLAIDMIRREKRTPIDHACKLEAEDIPDQKPAAEACCSSKQELLLVWEKVQVLPPQRRRTFILRKFNDMSYQDIADEMGITIGSVRKHLSAALSDCRNHLMTYQ